MSPILTRKDAGPVGRVDPVAVARLHLQAADIVLGQNRNEAEIAVRRRAEPIRIGFGRRRRIMQGAHEAHRVAVARREETVRQIQRGLEQWQQPQAKGRHGRVEAAERVLETVRPVRPRVDSVQWQPFHDSRVVFRQVRTDKVGFAEIGFRRLGAVLIGHRQIAAMAHIDPHRQFVGERQVEKALRLGEGRLDGPLRNPVIGDAEKPDTFQRGADVRRSGSPARLAPGEIVAQVDNGYSGRPNAVHRAVLRWSRFKLYLKFLLSETRR